MRARATAAAFAAGLVAAATLAASDAVAKEPVSFEDNGIRIVGRDLPPGISYDIDVVSAKQGADAVQSALDYLLEHSPYNRQAIEKLKGAGRVIVIYDPQFPKRELNKVTIAAYLPDYYDPGGASQDFVVVVGRFGAKWSPRELAPVMAHELTGHGMQDLRGRIEHVRVVDLECEAYLYQEKAYQDLGFDKSTQEMITFRQQLERYWCADFRTWLGKNRPETLKFWERLNPDVPSILDSYLAYIDALRTSGVSTRAVEANRKVIEAATAERLNKLAESASAKDHMELAMIHWRGIGVPVDREKAVEWFRKAAEAGLPDAAFQLSRAYWTGEGIGKDEAQAARWAKAAAEKGHAAAAYTYGAMLINGNGVPRDRDAGVEWMRKAAASGVKAAENALVKLGVEKTPQ